MIYKLARGFLFLCLIGSLALVGMCLFFTPPTTFVGSEDVSWMRRNMVLEKILALESVEGRFLIDGEEVGILYSELGVLVDLDTPYVSFAREPMVNRMKKFMLFKKNVDIILPLVDSEYIFDQKVEEKIARKYNENVRTGDIVYDRVKKMLVVTGGIQKIRVDTDDLMNSIRSTVVTKDLVYPNLIEVGDKIDRVLAEANNKMSDVLGREVMVNGVTISSKDLFEITEAKFDIGSELEIEVDRDLVKNKYIEGLSWIEVLFGAQEAINQRLRGVDLSQVIVNREVLPNTAGEYGSYIEIDLSSQKMHLFSDGSYIKTIPISTGKYYPTPAGRFKIHNKIPKAFSAKFGVWMPYWMAFDYRSDIGAWLGIHELAYVLTNGERVYRYGYYIGERGTGGCVALPPSESKYVYDFAYSGMEVFIFD